jgi:hypothetical protein
MRLEARAETASSDVLAELETLQHKAKQLSPPAFDALETESEKAAE